MASRLRLLAVAGAIDRCSAAIALDGFDEVRAMNWRRLNAKA